MPRDKVDVAKRGVDAFNRRDVDGFFAELATRDFELYTGTVRALGGDVYRGREGAERYDRDRSEEKREPVLLEERRHGATTLGVVESAAIASASAGTAWVWATPAAA